MKGRILAANRDNIEYLKFTGTVRYSHCAGLEQHINKIFVSKNFDDFVIDLVEAEILDSTALGLLAKIAIELKECSDKKPVIIVHHGELEKILKRVCFDQVFELVYVKPQDSDQMGQTFKELQAGRQTEEQILQRVIGAHKNLASLDQKNEKLYRDITDSLN